jgi:hypothetical protein
MVAKSFQSFQVMGEPFIVNGKQYVNVLNPKTNKQRQVRYYTENEYYKLYPEEKKSNDGNGFDPKIALGFNKGYITIFKGDTYQYLDWFRQSIARYSNRWGWYIASTDELPSDTPSELTPITLPWEAISNNNELKIEKDIKTAVEALIYADNDSKSEFVGKIGDRLEIEIVVSSTYTLENQYGVSTVHIFHDNKENEYVWITSSKSWEKGSKKTIRGTLKEHKTYKGVKQNVLTRCIER